MTDPLDALRAPVNPVDPDPGFAAVLRARLERAMLTGTTTSEGITMTSATEPTAHTLGSYIAVTDAREAIEFYIEAFGARPYGEPYVMDDGRIGHAAVVIGDSQLMLAEEFPEIGMLSPASRGGPSQSLMLDVGRPEDVDSTTRRAEAAGARVEREPADYPYGRNAVLVDPSGHRWMVTASPKQT